MGYNYQPQVVNLPDFWTINSRIGDPEDYSGNPSKGADRYSQMVPEIGARDEYNPVQGNFLPRI